MQLLVNPKTIPQGCGCNWGFWTEYTILRPAWLTDEDIIDYELTSRNEPFKGTIVSRKSVAALITDIIDKPEKHIGENIGINQPGTDGDKPFFM